MKNIQSNQEFEDIENNNYNSLGDNDEISFCDADLLHLNSSIIMTYNTSREQKEKEIISNNELNINQNNFFDSINCNDHENYNLYNDNYDSCFLDNDCNNLKESSSVPEKENMSNNQLEFNSKEQEDKKPVRGKNKLTDESKKLMGRKRKNDVNYNSKSAHNKLSLDNAIYKIKVKYHKFIYEHLNSYLSKDMKFKKIEGKITRNGNKKFNLDLLETTIKDFLKKPISSKYKKDLVTNEEILSSIEHITEVYDFLEQKYKDVFNKYFLMNENEYKEKYLINNKFLYNYVAKNNDLKQVWDELIQIGLYKYFKYKDGRKTIK